MLLRLLSLVSNAEQVTTTRELARKLGIGEDLLLKMLEDAVRMGYLSPADDRCAETPCATCHNRATCFVGGSPRRWSLTEKGRRLVDRHN